MQFRLLGPLEVDSGAGPIPLGGPKQRAVLAHLIMHASELVPADTLVDELWGDEPPENARNTIQAYVSRLRQAIGRERIEWRAPGNMLRVDASEVEAARFDRLLRDAKKALRVEPSVAVGVVEEALSLWRGPALAGLADWPSFAGLCALQDRPPPRPNLRPRGRGRWVRSGSIARASRVRRRSRRGATRPERLRTATTRTWSLRRPQPELHRRSCFPSRRRRRSPAARPPTRSNCRRWPRSRRAEGRR
jgi:hypothetical protein